MGKMVVSNEGGMEMEAKEAEMEIETQTEAKMEKNKEKGDGGSGSASSAAAASSSVMRWERFLPKMALRVLLVDADDSTRQIIAALLRKCSYRVAAVPDGLKAWEVLKARSHNIDLILTEVDLPSVSGFALLTLIMEHEICKNIPVIMMSSQDAVSTVYKCMLRGAADFLVKPIRKNELRNLWQHVWRKQASSGGGPGPPNESVAQQNFEATAENNAISNRLSGYMASNQRNRECAAKESDSQSSCAKPEMDTEGADIECMQSLSQPKRRKSLSSDINMQQKEERLMASRNFQMQDVVAAGSHAAAGIDCQTMTQQEDMNVDDHRQEGKFISQPPDSNHVLADPPREAIDLIGAFDNYPKCTNGNSGSDIGANKIDSSPLFELSLRRSHPSTSVNEGTDERHKLNHSDASAFSRFVYRVSQPQQSTSPSTCKQQRGYETNSDKQFSSHNLDYNSNTHAPIVSLQRHVPLATCQPGQAETAITCPQQRVPPAPIPVRGERFENLSNASGPVIPPMFPMQSGLSLMQSSGSVSHQEASFQANTFHPLNQQARNSQQYHGLRDQINNDATDQSECRQEHKLETWEKRGYFSSANDQSANSSFCNGAGSQLHSISYGSNGKDNPVIMVTSECGKEEAFPTHDGNSHRSMQREAALTKFRLKRKERCYGKKVRYESRKKLAEQRPRVKGQFVRQEHNEPPTGSS